jgi:hypothetical protein
MKYLKKFNESIFDEPSYRQIDMEDDDGDVEELEANKYGDLDFSEEEYAQIKYLCDRLNLFIHQFRKRLGLNKKMGPEAHQVINVVKVWKVNKHDGEEWYVLADKDNRFYDVDGFDSLLKLIEKFHNEFLERLK